MSLTERGWKSTNNLLLGHISRAATVYVILGLALVTEEGAPLLIHITSHWLEMPVVPASAHGGSAYAPPYHTPSMLRFSLDLFSLLFARHFLGGGTR